jgi:pyrroline-5-carboxylate reductase
MKIAIIGAGNMGGAIARGLSRGNNVTTSDITVANPHLEKLKTLQAEWPALRVTTDNRKAVKGADLVVLAIKPWMVQAVVEEIKSEMDYATQQVASVAAGIGTKQLGEWLFKDSETPVPPIYYIIPNTAISVGSSMTFIATSGAAPEQIADVKALFDELGETLVVEERLMGACMSLSSCGIAYAMRYIRASMEGGIQLGLYPKDALQIVLQTVIGAADLLKATGNHPEAEIDKVTTPGGFTIKGLNEMERQGFTNSVVSGLVVK